MLALSRRRDKIFLYQPEEGLAVPVFVDFGAKKVLIGMPEISELERDYIIYESDTQLADAAGPQHAETVRLAQSFSRHFSEVFRDEIERGDITIAQLRALILDLFRQQEGASASNQSRQAESRFQRAENHVATIPSLAHQFNAVWTAD